MEEDLECKVLLIFFDTTLSPILNSEGGGMFLWLLKPDVIIYRGYKILERKKNQLRSIVVPHPKLRQQSKRHRNQYLKIGT